MSREQEGNREQEPETLESAATWVVDLFDQANTSHAVELLGSRGEILKGAIEDLRNILNADSQKTILDGRQANESIRPLRPDEVAEQQIKQFPAEVMEAFNELIAEKASADYCTILQRDVVTRMISKGLKRQDIFNKGYYPFLFRINILKTHYRQILDYNFDLFSEVKSIAVKFINFLITLDLIIHNNINDKDAMDINTITHKYEYKFIEALDDDLNLSEGFSVIYAFMEEVNKILSKISKNEAILIKNWVLKIDKVFGFIEKIYDEYNKRLQDTLQEQEIHSLIQERERSRKNKDFNKADKLRKQLFSKGVNVNDTKFGSIIDLIEKI